MSADKQHKHAALVRFDERLQRFHKHHPILFALTAIAIVLILFGITLLINWLLKGGQ